MGQDVDHLKKATDLVPLLGHGFKSCVKDAAGNIIEDGTGFTAGWLNNINYEALNLIKKGLALAGEPYVQIEFDPANPESYNQWFRAISSIVENSIPNNAAVFAEVELSEQTTTADTIIRNGQLDLSVNGVYAVKSQCTAFQVGDGINAHKMVHGHFIQKNGTNTTSQRFWSPDHDSLNPGNTGDCVSNGFCFVQVTSPTVLKMEAYISSHGLLFSSRTYPSAQGNFIRAYKIGDL